MIIKDGIKFVENFAGLIDQSTPHLYLSALPFSPTESVMARYWVRFPGIVKVARGQHNEWSRICHAIHGHTNGVLSVAFSPGGRHIVSGSSDQTIQVWDAQTGGQVGNPLKGHTGWVNSVAFSPDGRHIVSGSDDQTIQVWDTQTGGQVGNPLKGHTGSVNSVAFSPDGRHIVSGSSDQTIQVWDAQAHGQVNCINNENKAIASNFPLIHFSSSPTHALQNVHSLFHDVPCVDKDYRDLIHLQKDGWIMGPNKKLLLWVPPSHLPHFLYTPWTTLVIPRGVPELDMSMMAHGAAWHKCYSPVPVTIPKN